jgi:catechol 2,3-dioxygenase-like lactoylglutathione lyase family enzyme
MLGTAELVAFVSTRDAAAARRFYEDALSLPLLEQTPFACVFRAPNAVLRVTTVNDLVPAAHTVLGWLVADIEAAARELAARGIDSIRYPQLEQDELGIWFSPSGARVLWFHDPDANVLSLTQS